MHKKVVCMLSLLIIIIAKPVEAMDRITQLVPQAQVVGDARMSLMFWNIYDVMLLAPNGKWSADKPFALQLTYLRHLDGSKIADRAVQEMRGQGMKDEVKLTTWYTQMRKIFPDVNEGDTLTGIFTKDGNTIFLSSGKEIGRIDDAEFTNNFSAIWLSPKTSAPEVRLRLLGQGRLKGQNNNETEERTGSHGTSSIY